MKLFRAVQVGRLLSRPLVRGGTFLAVPIIAFLLVRTHLPTGSAHRMEVKIAQTGVLSEPDEPGKEPVPEETPTRATPALMAQLQSQIQGMVREAPARKASVYVQDIGSGLVAAANPETEYVAASLIKLPVMGTVYENWEEHPQRKTPAARWWLELMITVSDNGSTDRLIDLVNGPEVVTQFCSERGWEKLKVRHAILNHRGRHGRNICTAREVGELLAALDRRELVSEQSDEEMWRVLCRSKKLTRIPAGVPRLPGVQVGNKTGTLSTVLHDAAIVRTPRTHYALCILLSKPRSESRGDAFCRGVSRLVFDTLHGPWTEMRTAEAR